MHRVSPKVSDLQMNETSNFPFQLESIVHFSFTPARPMHRVSRKLSGHTVVKTASFVTPSSRSESAMLSAESSKCMCDWMWDVSDIFESGKPCVSISPNSFTSSVMGTR